MGGELDIASTGEVSCEVGPLPIEQDAAKMQKAFGASAAPAHTGAVESHAYEVSDGALDCTTVPMSRSRLRISL